MYNIGSGNKVPNIIVVRMILGHLNKLKSLITFVRDRPGHDFRYSLRRNKTKELGWKPEIRFDQGLKATVDWCVENQDWGKPVA